MAEDKFKIGPMPGDPGVDMVSKELKKKLDDWAATSGVTVEIIWDDEKGKINQVTVWEGKNKNPAYLWRYPKAKQMV